MPEIETFGRRFMILDMDGTVTDSMGEWPVIIARVAAHFGAYLPDGYFDEVKGYTSLQTLEYIRKNYDIRVSFEEMREHFDKQAVAAFGTRVRIKDGVRDALEAFHAAGCKAALYSNSPIPVIRTVIERFGLKIDRGVSSEEIGLKEHIASFDKLIGSMGYTRGDTAVFDDSVAVLRNIAENGKDIFTVGVYDPIFAPAAREIKAIADDYIESFSDLFKRVPGEKERV